MLQNDSDKEDEIIEFKDIGPINQEKVPKQKDHASISHNRSSRPKL